MPKSRLLMRALEYYNSSDEERYGRDEQPDALSLLSEVIQANGFDPPGCTVVELGCGKGSLQYCHPHYVGIDLSFVALRKYFPRKNCIQGDIQVLPFRTQSVDLVFSFAALEHVPYPEECLADIDRILKPGGIAVIAPAWFCRPWAATALPARSYSELGWLDRLKKASIPVRENMIFRALWIMPQRLFRELRGCSLGERSRFAYKRLRPNLEAYIYTDCDAFSSMDPHAVILYYQSRGYRVLNARGFWQRVLFRGGPVIVKK